MRTQTGENPEARGSGGGPDPRQTAACASTADLAAESSTLQVIPKEFKLLNYTWAVVMNPGPVIAEDGDQVKGLCDYDERRISLNAALDADVLWHTWLHELTHAIFYAIGRHAQSDDEGLVDSFSGALAQVYPCKIDAS